ncbi:hypothetical protein [Carnimonas nigrificans]|uniref:hypothetical protein n=1 Tax=Carnimonas nigrificans TaxID=64323 RepID=UPI000472E2F4|nr:hypothetical protein [Carnimonas nigrificans]
MAPSSYPTTPDGRYFVAKDKLWRKTDPRLDEATRQQWVNELMRARRAVKEAKHAESATALAQARHAVNEAKIALGERGPVWWEDGAEDETGKHPRNSTYAKWWAELNSR